MLAIERFSLFDSRMSVCRSSGKRRMDIGFCVTTPKGARLGPLVLVMAGILESVVLHCKQNIRYSKGNRKLTWYANGNC